MNRRDFLAAGGVGASVIILGARPGAAQALGPDEIERRAADLVARMTLDEKIAMMAGSLTRFSVVDLREPFRTNNTPGCPRLGVPGIRFVDGSMGIRFTGATCFPVAMARGAAWDPELERRVGDVIGYEGRAGGANFFGGVCINLLRHPSWGRSQETFGEDPYHLGRMGAAVVSGVQEHMMACAKHFAGNSIELMRLWVDVRIVERTLREIYLPHFKACVDAGVASVMNAYNTLNGEPCAQNNYLLRDILKTEWGFPGFVLSDFGSIKSTVPSARAGCDVEMDRRIHYDWKLKAAVKSGLVPESAIDEAVARQVRQHLRFSHLEGAPGYDREKLGCPEHVAVARECAQKSLVLLKNERGALPLDRAKIKTIAVIGEQADKANLGGTWSTILTPAYVVSPLDGIRRAAGPAVKVIYADGRDLEEAGRSAARADAAVVVAGLTKKDENEGIDRLHLGLHEPDVDLVRKVAAANPRCIVVINAGGAVTMEEWKDQVSAILMAWYSGMEGGAAIADILFGDVNPSGKLPIVFPKSPDQLVPFNNRARQVEYGYYHGYRWFDKKGLTPAFPFGFGLSYTRYEYGNLRLSENITGRSGRIRALVDVTNSGGRAGEEIVQLYIGSNGSRVDRPVKDLKAFARVALAPGETKTVAFELDPGDLAFYDVERAAWEIEELEYTVHVGPSSRPDDLISAAFRIAGP